MELCGTVDLTVRRKRINFMEIIEVVDTAIKIGLGALISGVSTYIIVFACYIVASISYAIIVS